MEVPWEKTETAHSDDALVNKSGQLFLIEYSPCLEFHEAGGLLLERNKKKTENNIKRARSSFLPLDAGRPVDDENNAVLCPLNHSKQEIYTISSKHSIQTLFCGCQQSERDTETQRHDYLRHDGQKQQ